MQSLDADHTRLILVTAKRSSPYYRLYLTAILTGMRQGELLGLRWTDVDLATGSLAVRQTFQRLGRQQLFKAPKTKASRRTVALPEALISELRVLHEDQAQRRRPLGA